MSRAGLERCFSGKRGYWPGRRITRQGEFTFHGRVSTLRISPRVRALHAGRIECGMFTVGAPPWVCRNHLTVICEKKLGLGARVVRRSVRCSRCESIPDIVNHIPVVAATEFLHEQARDSMVEVVVRIY
jgi:hypothetical protein